MSTARTCTTPEEGWSLYSHFLGNIFMAIRFAIESKERDGDEKFKRVVDTLGARLTGYLYLIVRRMTQGGYSEEATKMQHILDLVTDGDLADLGVLRLIDAKHGELNPRVGAFEAELARLKAESGK